MKIVKLISLFVLFMASVLAKGQDSVRREVLQTVQVSSSQIPSEIQTATPTQVSTMEKIEQSGSDLLSEALRHMASLVIKDYGGVGGVKTISIRGLGSQFTTLTIDGVAVTDCQNGQIDLGRFMIGNSAYVSLANGQSDNHFQTARSYSSGSVINMETQKPSLSQRGFGGKVSTELGSLGYWSESVIWNQRISSKLTLSLFGNHTQSEGNYPFTLYYSHSHQDSSSREIRQNSQMNMNTLDANLFWDISSDKTLMVKGHLNQSYHALPGPVTYYSIKTSEHTEDANAFLQARFQHALSKKLQYRVVGKFYQSNCIYEDTSVNTLAGKIRNEYRQREYYLSEIIVYVPVKGFTVSFSADEALNQLRTNLANDPEVNRFSGLFVWASSYATDNLTANIHLLGTLCSDNNPSGEIIADYRRISPYAGITYKVFSHHDSMYYHSDNFRLRFFFKENYRIPTFNELYYFTISRDLLPEKALQSNVGITYENSSVLTASSKLYLTSTLDLYYNHIKDKLIAIPTQNLFLWSMMNFGRVDIWGADFTSMVEYDWNLYTFSIKGNYSFQRAWDVTDPGSKNYHQQIPYTPVHSGGVELYFQNPYVNIGYNFVAVGMRYKMSQNTPNNEVKGYFDHGFILSKEIYIKGKYLGFQAQVLNLMNVQYEVIKSYPMMGRNYRFNVSYKF